MKRGYVKNWRRIKECSFYKKPKTMHLAQHIVREANHKDSKFFDGESEVIVKRGQLCTGRKKLAEETGLSEQEVRTGIKILKKCDFLTSKSTNKGSIITVCNYSQYQEEKTGKQPASQPMPNQQATSKQPLLKNVKNVKNERSNKNFLSDSDEFRLAELLFNKICERNPNHKKPKIQTWSKHIDYMLRIDKRDKSNIEKIIIWCQKDSFWQNNILSTSKLRDKFDELLLKMKSNGGNHGKNGKNNSKGTGFAEAKKSGKTNWLE